MVSLQNDTSHQAGSSEGTNSTTGPFSQAESQLANMPLDKGHSSSNRLTAGECSRTQTNNMQFNQLHHGSTGQKQSCLHVDSATSSPLPQAQQHLYTAEHTNNYSSQTPVIWTNRGNGFGLNSINYGGFFRPNPIYYAEHGDNHPTFVRSLRGAVDLPAAPRSVSESQCGQQNSCSVALRFKNAKFAPSKSSLDSESRSFGNAHASMQSYFLSDELDHQPVVFPYLMYEQNFPSITWPLPTQVLTPHSTTSEAIQTQMETKVTMPISNQFPVPAQTSYFQHQALPLMPCDVPVLSHQTEALQAYFPQSSLHQLCSELQSNSSACAFEGTPPPDRCYPSNGFYEMNEAKFACTTSIPVNGVQNQELVCGKLKKDFLENESYTRISLGRAMNAEGQGHTPKAPLSSCMFLRREVMKSYASSSSENFRFENLSEIKEKPPDTTNDIDVVSVDLNSIPDRMLDVFPALPASGTTETGSIESERKTRMGSRELECKVCGKRLARTSTLKIHMRQHTGDRPYKCVTCEKTFAQAGLLQSHRRTHTGERPYTCSHCCKKFSHSGALKTHLRTHTGERPHKCRVPGCSLAFGDSSTLSKHARTHTGERPYCCDICGKRFTQSGNMHKHKKGVHNIQNSSKPKSSTVLEEAKLKGSIEMLLLPAKR